MKLAVPSFWIMLIGVLVALTLYNLPQLRWRQIGAHQLAERVPVENRDGQLSRAQVWVLAARLLGLVCFLVVQVPLALPKLRTAPAPFIWLVVLAFALVLGLPFVLTASDLMAGRAESSAGMATSSVRWGRSGPTYRCSIEDHTFKVPRAVHEAITTGGWYRIYYTPYSKTFLAIEPGR